MGWLMAEYEVTPRYVKSFVEHLDTRGKRRCHNLGKLRSKATAGTCRTSFISGRTRFVCLDGLKQRQGKIDTRNTAVHGTARDTGSAEQITGVGRAHLVVGSVKRQSGRYSEGVNSPVT